MDIWQYLAIGLLAAMVIAYLVFAFIAIRPVPYPPMPKHDLKAWLEWQAGNPNLLPAIRYAACKTLCKIADDEFREAQIRRVIREELAR